MSKHLGSMAVGSFVIALCQLLRLVLHAVDRATKSQQESNLLLKLVVKCSQCAAYCLQKTVEFVSFYGYVFVAIDGSSFCRACRDTFVLVASYPSQAAVNGTVKGCSGCSSLGRRRSSARRVLSCSTPGRLPREGLRADLRGGARLRSELRRYRQRHGGLRVLHRHHLPVRLQGHARQRPAQVHVQRPARGLWHRRRRRRRPAPRVTSPFSSSPASRRRWQPTAARAVAARSRRAERSPCHRRASQRSRRVMQEFDVNDYESASDGV